MKKILMILLVFLLSIGTVFANGLPTYEEGNGSGFVSIDENTNIYLIEEKVSYTIENVPKERKSHLFGINSSIDDSITASVTVTYKLKCGEVPEETIMHFILPRVNSGYVTVNGDNVDEHIFTESLPESIDWSPKGIQDYNARDNHFYSAAIPLSFDAKEEKTIIFNYIPSSGFDRSSTHINGVYDLLYYLTPAEYWAGETTVNLELKIPDELSYKSNIKLSKSDDNTHIAKLNEIPNEEWFITISHMHDRYFITNSSIIQNSIIIILLMLLYQSYRLVNGTYREKYRIFIYLVCCFIWFKLNVDIFGYPFGPLFVWLGYMIIFIIVPGVYIIKKINDYIKGY